MTQPRFRLAKRLLVHEVDIDQLAGMQADWLAIIGLSRF